MKKGIFMDKPKLTVRKGENSDSLIRRAKAKLPVEQQENFMAYINTANHNDVHQVLKMLEVFVELIYK